MLSAVSTMTAVNILIDAHQPALDFFSTLADRQQAKNSPNVLGQSIPCRLSLFNLSAPTNFKVNNHKPT